MHQFGVIFIQATTVCFWNFPHVMPHPNKWASNYSMKKMRQFFQEKTQGLKDVHHTWKVEKIELVKIQVTDLKNMSRPFALSTRGSSQIRFY